jgi:hypothetical protein
MRAPTYFMLCCAVLCRYSSGWLGNTELAHTTKVFLHESTYFMLCCAVLCRYSSGWLGYTELAHTTKVFVRESSMAPTYSMLIFGGALEVDPGTQMLTLDGWMEFKAAPKV